MTIFTKKLVTYRQGTNQLPLAMKIYSVVCLTIM